MAAGAASPAAPTSSSAFAEVRVWSWTGRTRRHTVQFRHNTFSGSQLLEVDGVTIHRTRFQYKLTGCLVFEVGGTTVELYILADDIGALTYRLTLDGKELSPEAKRAVSTWVVRASDGLHQVEFEHISFDVLVDGFKVEATGDFVEEGSAYSFELPSTHTPCTITVIPQAGERGKRTIATTLTADGTEVPQSETLGSDDAGGSAVAGGAGASSAKSVVTSSAVRFVPSAAGGGYSPGKSPSGFSASPMRGGGLGGFAGGGGSAASASGSGGGGVR